MSLLAFYVSTSCLKEGGGLSFVLDLYRMWGIKNIELGSSHDRSSKEAHEFIRGGNWTLPDVKHL